MSQNDRLKALVFIFFLAASACRVPLGLQPTTQPDLIAPTQESSTPHAPSATPAPTATLSPSPRPSLTPTASPSPTITGTPAISPTPTISLTPTFDFPDVRVLMQANCRYGPGTAYLYSHGLYENDRAQLHGRNYNGTWLWIQPENLDRHCWVSASVVEVDGDILSVVTWRSRLPFTTFIGPPGGVDADRNGEQVSISWSPVNVKPPEDSRGYLLELTVCQNGLLLPLAAHTEEASYTIKDEEGCSGDSGGRLYAVEKHGYTDPVTIPWP